ncbi:MAG: hypothetical protein ACRYHA_09740 [Janthinobacterium lividum]
MIAEAMPIQLGMLFALPFHAWPLAWRLGVWGIVAAVVAVSVQAGWAPAGRRDRRDGAAAAEALILARIDEAERRAAKLPALRARAGKLARPGRPVPAAGVPGARGVAAPGIAGGADSDEVSSAALLGWIEQAVLASRVSLLAFEPVDASSAQTMWRVDASRAGGLGTGEAGADAGGANGPSGDDGGANASSVDAWHTDALPADAFPADASGAGALNSGMPANRGRDVARWRAHAARLQVEGNYPQVRALLERLARTRPALLIDAATLRAAGGMVSLTLRFWTLGLDEFALRPAPSRQSGDARLANPFARRRLPDATGAARLLGTLVSGRRRAALLALQQATCFVEIGGTVGDARVQAIGRDSTTLAPLADGPARTLRLRE